MQHVGKLTPEERLQKILRYRAKRQLRNFNRTIKYQCRKSLADTRPRVRGRFARDNEPGSVLPHETKKALREKAKTGSPPPPDVPEQRLPPGPPPPLQAAVASALPMGSMAMQHPGAPRARAQAPMQPAVAGHAGPAGSPALLMKEDPGAADATLLIAPGRGVPAVANGHDASADSHVIGLAHLYNAWSEMGPQPTKV